MAYSKAKILDTIQVSPPTGSVPTTSLSLTLFDMEWFHVGPVERLFFYEFPHPTSYFMETTLPLLKRSLSQAFQHFFPYASNIMCPQPPGKPYIHYIDGGFATITVAESAADFNHLVANYPRDTKLFRPFVPQLPPARVAEDGTRVLPTIAFQVTVFPNSGLCLGSTYCHVVGDGKSNIHFMRSWASITRSGGAGDLTCLENSLPSFNRDVIKSPAAAELANLKSYWYWVSSSSGKYSGPTNLIAEDKVRVTIVLSRAHAERLKHLIRARCMKGVESEQFHLSTFVVTTALTWVCLLKSKDQRVTKDSSHDDDDDDDKFYYLLFSVDCRNRLEFPVPATYFGNCLKPCLVDVKGSEILGEDGIVLAARAIGNKIKEMDGNKGLEDAVHWGSSIFERIKTGRLTSLAGSPKFQVYDMDFGWGRPCKVEVTHIDHDGAICLAECRDEQGGIEVGLALNKNQMDEFIPLFEKSLKLL